MKRGEMVKKIAVDVVKYMLILGLFCNQFVALQYFVLDVNDAPFNLVCCSQCACISLICDILGAAESNTHYVELASLGL